MISNKNYNFDLAKKSGKKLMFEIANEMFFDEKPSGNESTKDKSFIRLLKPPANLASGISTKFFTRKT